MHGVEIRGRVDSEKEVKEVGDIETGNEER